MKKVFLSVPMKNRTKENIEKSLEKMRKHVCFALDEEVEFINTIVQDKPPYENCHEAVWYLGKSIELMSQADMLVTVDVPYWIQSPGCRAEKRIFEDYIIDERSPKMRWIELPIGLVFDEEEIIELKKIYDNSEQAKCETNIPCSPRGY